MTFAGDEPPIRIIPILGGTSGQDVQPMVIAKSVDF